MLDGPGGGGVGVDGGGGGVVDCRGGGGGVVCVSALILRGGGGMKKPLFV